MAGTSRPPPLHPRDARGLVRSPEWHTPTGPMWPEATDPRPRLGASRVKVGPSGEAASGGKVAVTPKFRAVKSEGL